jgi:hypothetical protein
MQPSMDLAVTVRTDQEALLKFTADGRPGSSVPFRSDPELLVLAHVVKRQGVQAAGVTTKATTSTKELNRSAFQAFPFLGDVVLEFAPRTTEASLPSDQGVPTAMPGTTFRNSRLLYH